ncbi:neuroblastoma breakpoint family member 4-like [Piliocolobus tephrosceles]|uniref:neuroblastoma breakpoint family member 4-like n=1 Tax=Piliocolobus tephrosceles TaxID=591936 RepID=UPI000E6B0EE1|nr:neuroblastoma breakpoint family member 4-like [Piliocolobus tephrosceles]
MDTSVFAETDEEKQNNLEEVKGKETVDPRLSRRPLREDKREVPQESLDGCCWTPSILSDLPHSNRPYWSTSYCFEDKQVSLALVDKIEKDQEELEDQDPPCPRLIQELPEVEEQEIPEVSVDEVYLTPSVHCDLSDCHQPYSSTLSSLESQLACSALDIACEYPNLEVTKLCYPPRQPLYVLFPATYATETDHLCGKAVSPERVLKIVCKPSLGMKNPPQLEDDALEGSADNSQGCQVIGQIHASSVLKPKIIKRKLPFSKWRLAFRFPCLQA